MSALVCFMLARRNTRYGLQRKNVTGYLPRSASDSDERLDFRCTLGIAVGQRFLFKLVVLRFSKTALLKRYVPVLARREYSVQGSV